MAINERFNVNRPLVLLDPRASQRIDPRITYARNSVASYYDRYGVLRTAAVNEARLCFHPITKELMGLYTEPAATNLITNSATGIGVSGSSPPTLTTVTQALPDGTSGNVIQAVFPSAGDTRLRVSVAGVSAGTYILSFYAKKVGTAFWYRAYSYGTTTTSTITIDTDPSATRHPLYASIPTESFYSKTYYITFIQLERIIDGRPSVPTSFIKTSGSAVTRAADLIFVSAAVPPAGSVYINAQGLAYSPGDRLVSLKNSSDETINLEVVLSGSTYNSSALLATYKGTSKPALPLPVPTSLRERNIVTWGAKNYQYSRDISRFAASLSSSVPIGLERLSIGHDAVDPTKAFNGYISTLYLWAGEITPTVAEALVRNDLTTIDADTYTPVGPAGALALIINTQGASSTGDKTFTLPAESAANDNDLTITWGDGTESNLDGAFAEVGATTLTHTYPSAGIYPVWVEGQMENIAFNNSSSAVDVLRLVSWGTGDVLNAPSTMANAFYGCSQMDFSDSARTTNLPDTSAATSWYRAFRGCANITGTFPAFNFSAATTFQEAWYGCSSMTSFVAAGDQTQNVTNFTNAWCNCSSLTSFPLINTAAGTNFGSAWQDCSSLTSFPLINTAAGTNFNYAWFNCSSLTSFPLINTAAGTSFGRAWQGCSSLTSFPLINTAAGTNFGSAWQGCSSLTSFPLINTSAGTSFDSAWYGCSSLTSFPLINTAAGTSFGRAWYGCSSLTSFPLINTAAGTSFNYAWLNCDGLTEFPALNFNAATGLASDASTTYTGFRGAWYSCGALTTFPANLFDSTTCTRYLDAWTGCALTAQSIENIIVSINAAGTSNGNLGLSGGTNAGASTWTAAAVTAYNALVARGWTITRNA